MPANTKPIYSKLGEVSTNATTGMAALNTAVSNNYDGATSAVLVFTADATNGGFIQRLRFKAGGSNAASNARIFLNNGATVATGTNNAFYGEVSLPATTAIATAATVDIDYPMNFALPAGFRVYVVYTSTIAGGWACVGIGGKY